MSQSIAHEAGHDHTSGEHQKRSGLPSCFGSPCPGCAQYTHGSWQRTLAEPLYRLEHKLWMQMNVRSMPGNSNHNWGLCDDVASGPSGLATAYGPTRLRQRARGVERTRYQWRPDNCRLRRFERAAACRAFRGLQVLVAGDSATAQFFLSLALQLGGPHGLGKNRRGGSAVIKDVTASACDDSVRLNFVRNDLLLWTSQVEELRELGKLCTAGRGLLQPFANRVADADLLVLGTGHHYPHVMRGAGEQTSESLFTRSLNHTLSLVAARRSEAGHAPDSVVVLGAPWPVAGCSRFSAPISAATALLANSSLHKWSGAWQQARGFDRIAKWLAAEHRMHFLDIAPLSMRRPDDSLGRWCRLSGLDCYKRDVRPDKHGELHRRAGGATGGAPEIATRSHEIQPDADYWEEDCLHTCLPGPIDEYVRLLYNLVDTRPRASEGALAPSRRRRFFEGNLSRWLYAEGAEQLEPCADASNPACAFLSEAQGLAHCAPWTTLPATVKGRAFPWVRARLQRAQPKPLRLSKG